MGCRTKDVGCTIMGKGKSTKDVGNRKQGIRNTEHRMWCIGRWMNDVGHRTGDVVNKKHDV